MNRYLDALAVTEAHSYDEVNAQLLRLGITDGLPVVPPIPAKVEAMLRGRDPRFVAGVPAPARGQATLRRMALCTVMAGCRPEYFPILIAAVGGLGIKSAYVPSWGGGSHAVTRRIEA